MALEAEYCFPGGVIPVDDVQQTMERIEEKLIIQNQEYMTDLIKKTMAFYWDFKDHVEKLRKYRNDVIRLLDPLP